MSAAPQRIVCLSAEAADWLWRIGAWDKVVGVTAFFTQPPNELVKPRVSGFSSANLEQITRLQPDLVITFSDVQAKLAAELVRRGLPVLATNQRTLAEIESTLALLGRIVGREAESENLLCEFRERLAPLLTERERSPLEALGKCEAAIVIPRAADEGPSAPPRVYFEEWNDPLISGIAWVSELIERAGGKDIFSDLRSKRSAPERVISPEQVCQADPEIILASWCGEPVQTEIITARPGWQDISAVRAGRIHEIPGEDILQAGFRLVYGYEQIKRHLQIPKCATALSH